MDILAYVILSKEHVYGFIKFRVYELVFVRNLSAITRLGPDTTR